MSKHHTELYYHIVWGTWKRMAMIHPSFEQPLYRYLHHKAHEAGYQMFAANGMEDHAHVVVRLRPTVAVSVAAKRLKGSSSHFVRGRFSRGFAWQEGYGAFTFSKRDLDRVVAYVRNQKAHHARGSTAAKYEPMGDGEGS